MKYPMLADQFSYWFKKEYTDAEAEWLGYGIPDEMLKNLKLTHKEFFEIYVRPYLNLDKVQLRHALNYLASHLKDRWTPQPSPLILNLEMKINPRLNALEWLLIQVADLKYFEFNEFLTKHYEKPYNQCLVCGKPDYYEITNPNNKIIKRYFSHKKKYCHMFRCAENCSNLQEHEDGCHYKEWAYLKKSMNQKLSRCLKRINKYKSKDCTNLSEEEKDKINKVITETQEEFYNIFEKFYLEQYEKNMKIPYPVRDSEDTPIFDMRNL